MARIPGLSSCLISHPTKPLIAAFSGISNSGYPWRMSDSALIGFLQELRIHLARSEIDFSWSGWNDSAAALREIDGFIEVVKDGGRPDFGIIFLPTGPAQEVSLSSGWADEFQDIANRLENYIDQRVATVLRDHD